MKIPHRIQIQQNKTSIKEEIEKLLETGLALIEFEYSRFKRNPDNVIKDGAGAREDDPFCTLAIDFDEIWKWQLVLLACVL